MSLIKRYQERFTGEKYQFYYYCPYCRLWIPKDSKEIGLSPSGIYLIHLLCGGRIRTKPRKRYANPSDPRIDPQRYGILVTPVTGGKPR